MPDQPSSQGQGVPADGAVVLPGALEAIIRALAGVLTSANVKPQQRDGGASDKLLLDLEETAELLGVSRMTVARMADEGRLPSVIVRRGQVQKTRRIPRAFIDRMLADACAGVQVDMEQYAASWLVEHVRESGLLTSQEHRKQLSQ